MPKPKPRVKAGTSKSAAAERRKRFRAAYMANGHNATKAAIAAGYSAKTAGSAGRRLLKDVRNAGDLAQAAEEMSRIVGLDAERTLREVARLSYCDPRKFFRPDGTLVPIIELDDDSAAALASIVVLEEYAGVGEERTLIGNTKTVKLWDKNASLEKAMKHQGLYEKDNAQQQDSLVLNVSAAVPVKR